RFALKRRAVERRVGMLEGLYWTADGATDLEEILGPDRGAWRWTLLIALPDEATDEELADALAKGWAKVPPEVAESLRIEPFAEGAVAQVLHLGPYADERPTIERLHAAIAAAGLRPRGRHHELYLGDPGRSAPAKLRTLIRHAVQPA
ncbi:MAG: GyrI-like domain-containing protein, partial [Chloroflexota bacterium]